MDYLSHPETMRIVQNALKEDIGTGDYTGLSTIYPHERATARCIIKDHGILAGMEVARLVFATLDPDLEMTAYLEDGSRITKGDIPFIVEGSAQHILMAERTVLNILQRMSGIATQTRSVVDMLEGTNCKVLDTRKTTPLIRHLEKWAVHIGGGVNHRFGLYDMVLIKDNHIDYAGGVATALKRSKAYLLERGLTLDIVVETRNIQEVKEVLDEGGAKRILLDNMRIAELVAAVSFIGNAVETEASGGITLENVRQIAETGVDYVSMGALTHSVRSLDISLKAVRKV